MQSCHECCVVSQFLTKAPLGIRCGEVTRAYRQSSVHKSMFTSVKKRHRQAASAEDGSFDERVRRLAEVNSSPPDHQMRCNSVRLVVDRRWQFCSSDEWLSVEPLLRADRASSHCQQVHTKGCSIRRS